MQTDESLVAPVDVHANALQGLLELPAELKPYRPVVAWQIDAFGHAPSTPGVLHSLGFTHVMLSRVPEKVVGVLGFGFWVLGFGFTS